MNGITTTSTRQNCPGMVGRMRVGWRTALSGLLVGGLLVLASGAALAKANPADGGNITSVALSDLPVQARQTYSLIQQGGPYPYDKDGSVFGNRERLLPQQKRGYYREYTVKTPQSRDRGARRIVCGGVIKPPEVCYYTADHYASFRKIAE
jgi:ribonuclease T1